MDEPQLKRSLIKDDNTQPQAPRDAILQSDVDSSLKYFFIFLFLGGGVAVWFSYRLSIFNNLPSVGNLVNVMIFALLLLLIVIFHSLMVRSFKLNVLLAILEIVGLLSFFFSNFSAWFAVGGLVFFLFWLWGYKRGKVELKTALKIHFSRYAGLIINATLLGFAIFLSLLYAGLYQKVGTVSYNVHQLLVSGSAPAFKAFVPNFVPDMTVDAFLDDFVETQLESRLGLDQLSQQAQQEVAPVANSGFRSLIPAIVPDSLVDSIFGQSFSGSSSQFGQVSRSLVNQVKRSVKNSIIEKTGLDIRPDQSVTDYTYALVNNFFADLNERGLMPLIIILIIVLIFFPLRFLLSLVKWPVVWIAGVIYFFLKQSGVIVVGNEQRNKEVIVVR